MSLLYWYKSTNTDAEGAGKGGWNLRGAAGRAPEHPVPYYDAARARVKVKAGEVPSFLLLLQTYTTVAGVYRMRRMLTYADVC